MTYTPFETDPNIIRERVSKGCLTYPRNAIPENVQLGRDYMRRQFSTATCPAIHASREASAVASYKYGILLDSIVKKGTVSFLSQSFNKTIRKNLVDLLNNSPNYMYDILLEKKKKPLKKDKQGLEKHALARAGYVGSSRKGAAHE